MGIRLAFSPGGADFSGMARTENLFITKVIHRGNVALDEQGTEAAAATAVVVGGLFSMSLRADRTVSFEPIIRLSTSFRTTAQVAFFFSDG